MLNKKKGAKAYEEDYTKIKPGYVSKRTPDSENFNSEGFRDVIKDDKMESRNKALDAQARYKLELDAQLHAKRSGKQTTKDSAPVYQASPLGELPYQKYGDASPKKNGYQEDDGGMYGSQSQSSAKYDYKEKNLTEAERQRLEEQRRKKAEMKDVLDQQVLEKQRQKEVKKSLDDDHARKIAFDNESSKHEELRQQQIAKDRKQDYAGDLKKQIGANQTYKKTNLW